MKVILFLALLLTLSSHSNAQAIWFDDIKESTEIPLKDIKVILGEINKYLNNESDRFTLDINNDVQPRIVFLSITNINKPTTVVTGSGNGLKQAIKNALAKIKINSSSLNNHLIKLDIVKNVIEVRASKNTRMDLYDAGLYGVAFDKKSGAALLPVQVSINKLFNKDNRLDAIALNNIVDINNSYTDTSSLLTLYRFSTYSYLHDNENTTPLYRGHKLFNSISLDNLLTSTFNAGTHLLQSIKKDGRFIYSYNPATANESNEYNILRHAGTVYALLQLYELNKDDKLLAGIESTLDFMLKQIKPCSNSPNEEVLCLVHRNKIKLGANALGILALTKYAELTHNTSNNDTINQLGLWIANNVRESGEFKIHKQYYKSKKVSKFRSEYYPGEATLALLALYKHDNNRQWLNTAVATTDYIIKQQQTRKPPHDHWLLYTLTEIYKYKPNKKYLTHSRYIAEEIMSTQNLKPIKAEQYDWKGSFNLRPESAPTATRTEGLIAAYELLNDENDAKYKRKLLDSITAGILFQQQLQIDKASTIYFKEPEKTINAFRRSLNDFRTRIDYSQHNISSFLGYHKMINSKNKHHKLQIQ